MSVVVLDDHPAIAAGVMAWCAAADPPIHVLDAGQKVTAVWGEPGRSADIVLLDLHLDAGGPAYETLRQLTGAGRTVIVYSQRTDDATALRCIQLGAFTYLSKAEGAQHLVPAIHAAAQDRPYVSPSLGGAMAADRRRERPRLSPRETEVLTAWFESGSKAMVAARMHLSVKSVETLIERVRRKYDAAGRPAPTKAALLERALQDGIIDLNPL